jgi:soluble lytic murein transglycosylase-like protein
LVLKALLLAPLFPIFTGSAASNDIAGDACEREMLRAAQENSIPVAVLYAVALTESGQRGAHRAYAMNVDGRPIFNENLPEALARFAEAKRRGAKYIDIGCMQINHLFHGRRFNSLEDMFDARRNVDYAAALLNALRAKEGNWTAAVARYHAGPRNQRAQKSYVCAVIGNMVAGGFGSWTPESEAYCRP